MGDTDQTKRQLIAELGTLRARVAEVEAAKAERKQAADDVLHASGERFRLLAENSPDYIYIFDLKQRKAVYFNREEFLGYTTHDFLGPDSLLNSLHPEDKARVLQHWQQLTTGKGPDTLATEYRLRHKKGDWEWIYSRETVMARDAQDNPSQILFNLTVITERKRAEEALQASETRYRRLFETAKDGILILDSATGQIDDVNPFLIDMLGYSHDELLGKKIWEIGPLKNIAASRAAFAQLRKQGYIRHENLPLETRDGKQIAVEFVSNIYQVNHKAVIQCNIRDITERKRAEEALRRSNMELQARNEELDAFGHMVAHDLKNPLTEIVGYAGLLADSSNPFSEEDARKVVPTILEMGLKMDSIIEELMLLTGLRRMDVKTEPLDMTAIVNEVQRRLARVIEEAHARIICPASWPSALGYAPWIEEVWINYLSNAIKYGGEPAHAELGATREGNRVRFWVRDNGPGLSPEEQARLFVPFERLGQMRITGHGLGLSIVRRIVERMGGQVSVESAGVPGEGSTFSFALPVAQEKP